MSPFGSQQYSSCKAPYHPETQYQGIFEHRDKFYPFLFLSLFCIFTVRSLKYGITVLCLLDKGKQEFTASKKIEPKQKKPCVFQALSCICFEVSYSFQNTKPQQQFFHPIMLHLAREVPSLQLAKTQNTTNIFETSHITSSTGMTLFYRK